MAEEERENEHKHELCPEEIYPLKNHPIVIVKVRCVVEGCDYEDWDWGVCA